MSLTLTYQTPEGATEYALADGRVSLGAGPDCEIVLNHSEVPLQALTLEINGDAAVLYNRCEYPIYVDQEEVAEHQPAAWPHGATVYLTTSTTLTLYSNNDDALAEMETAASSSNTRKATQLAVIGLCAMIGLQLMLSEPVESHTAPKETFRGLSKELLMRVETAESSGDALVTYRWQEAQRLLQEAWYYDRRIGKRRRKEMTRAFQRLLDCEVLQRVASDATGPQSDDNSLEARLIRFGTAKKTQYGD